MTDRYRSALELYRGLAEPGENLIFSPASILAALSLLRVGAEGETAAELDAWMGQAGEGIEASIAAIDGASMANRLWIPEPTEAKPGFVEALSKRGGGVSALDFSDGRAAAERVNAWVKDKTRGEIPGIVGEGDFPKSPPDDGDALAFILTNALYFKGAWRFPFDEDRSQEESFWIEAERSAPVTMMQLKHDPETELRWARQGDADWLELPYQDGERALVLIKPRVIERKASLFERLLPRRGPRGPELACSLAEVEAGLSSEAIASGLAALAVTKVVPFIPRLRLAPEEPAELSEVLEKRGLGRLFDQHRCQLGGVVEAAAPLWIGSLRHRASIAIDEEGTVAAAVTAAMARAGGVPSFEVFRADHPFLFLLVDHAAENVLFMGRVQAPP